MLQAALSHRWPEGFHSPRLHFNILKQTRHTRFNLIQSTRLLVDRTESEAVCAQTGVRNQSKEGMQSGFPQESRGEWGLQPSLSSDPRAMCPG